jgi:hypothetical protein
MATLRLSAGTCQAPQTTAMFSYERRTSRSTVRMYASRTRSSGSSGDDSRMAAIASPMASNAGIPRCSTTSSHHRSGSS